MSRVRGLRPAAAIAAATFLLAACAQVPREGAVVEVRERPQPPVAEGQYNHPKGPQRGDDPAEVVSGFLVAMTATPLETRTAREFLSAQGQGRWRPQRVVTYQNRTVRSRGTDVVVRLRGADQVGSRGQWQGSVSRNGRRIDFPMVNENGEWRIAQAPDALVVPRTFYDQQYEAAAIYFFDPSGRILVPEPVHVLGGQQLASSLVRALLRGPQPALDNRVTRTFVPRGLDVASVPVDGQVAAVNLKGPDPGTLSQKSVGKLLAQLAWTLRQDPSIMSFTLTIAGHAITDASGAMRFSVTGDEFDPYDPTYGKANLQTYALSHGRLVSGQLGHLSEVQGPFGDTARDIGPFAVNLGSSEVAAVTPGALLLGEVLGASEPTTLLTGPGLLRPAWDFANRLWEIQNTSRGADVVYVVRGTVHGVHVPGISGRTVRRFLVARDGSRIVAVLHGPEADHIVTSRIRYGADGRPTGATHARAIRWASPGTKRIRDIGWTTPTTIAVLDQLSQVHAELRILNVDGSLAPDETSPSLINGRVSGLATSPVAVQTPYAVQHGALYDISQVDLPQLIPNHGLRHLTYAG